jgi:hypothetical protein
MDLEAAPLFFEQIRGGAAETEHVWLKKLRVELVYRIRSGVELCQIRPKLRCVLLFQAVFVSTILLD